MKKAIPTIISVICIIGLCIVTLALSGFTLSETQMKTLNVLIIVCLSSILYCFVVGEIANNNSQMDKLWSILPIAYTWIIAAYGGFKLRLVIYALIVTLWGIRLTFNFGRKGAYSIKFWTGKEDYRWEVLRKKKLLSNRFTWALFDLFFICFYQNALVLAITLPMLGAMESTVAFNFIDIIAIALSLLFLAIETIADEEQWVFQQTKKKLLSENANLAEISEPYNLGFNTTGLWAYMRHPNYLGEQAIWVSLYVFLIAAKEGTYGVFHWTLIGPLLLILLFLGSSAFGESISQKKYPKYQSYQDQVFKYLPIHKYDNTK